MRTQNSHKMAKCSSCSLQPFPAGKGPPHIREGRSSGRVKPTIFLLQPKNPANSLLIYKPTPSDDNNPTWAHIWARQGCPCGWVPPLHPKPQNIQFSIQRQALRPGQTYFFSVYNKENTCFTAVKQNTSYQLFSMLWVGRELRKANQNSLLGAKRKKKKTKTENTDRNSICWCKVVLTEIFCLLLLV